MTVKSNKFQRYSTLATYSPSTFYIKANGGFLHTLEKCTWPDTVAQRNPLQVALSHMRLTYLTNF